MTKEEMQKEIRAMHLGSNQWICNHPARAVAQDISVDQFSKHYKDAQIINLKQLCNSIHKMGDQKEIVLTSIAQKITNEKLIRLVELMFEDAT